MYKRASRRQQDAAHRQDLYYPGKSPNYGDKTTRDPGPPTAGGPAPVPEIDGFMATAILVTAASLYGAGWITYQIGRGVFWSGKKIIALVRPNHSTDA